MSKDVVGTSPTTGEVLVHDTETDDYSWEPGTEAQIESATAAIVESEITGVYEAPEYSPPEVPPPPPPPPPPPKIVIYTRREVPPEVVVEKPEEVSALSVSIGFISWLIERFNWLGALFYNIGLEFHSWIFPFYLLAQPFFRLQEICADIAWGFVDFGEWVIEVHDRVKYILSWSTIWSYITSWVPNLLAISDWFSSWWDLIREKVVNWFETVKPTIVGWIDAARDWVKLWVEAIEKRTNELTSIWNNFVAVTLPTLPNWLDIDRLIKSWFQNFESSWEGWQELRSSVTEFIKDPEQWFHDRLEEIFERFW